MSDVNVVMLIGNMGADININTYGTDGRVGSFSLAVKNYKKGVVGVDWFRVVVWNKMHLETLEKWGGKGSKLHVQGRLFISEYEKDGVTVRSPEIHIEQFNSNIQLLTYKDNAGETVLPKVTEFDTKEDTEMDEIPF